MNIKNNKNLIGNIVIIISTVLVILCIFMCFSTQVQMESSDTINWNDMHFILVQGLVCDEQSDDLIKFSGGYGRHDIEVRKTNDLTNYNKYINVSVSTQTQNGYFRTEFNDTHKIEFVQVDDHWLAVVAPTNLSEARLSNNDIQIGNLTIYEFTCPEKEFLISFTHSITKATSDNEGGVQFV